MSVHDDEIEVSEGAVRELIASQFPGWRSRAVRRVRPAGRSMRSSGSATTSRRASRMLRRIIASTPV